MAIRLDDRFGGFFEIVVLAQLMRDRRQDLLHRQANRALRIRDDTVDRHRQSIRDLTQQGGEVGLACTGEAAREQDFTRERVAQHP